MTGEQGKGRGEVEYAATVKKVERELGGVKQSATGRNGSWHGMGEFTAFKDMLLAGLDR
jgi:acyl-CoA reductase-like NAD-dependent aldehyde dehydrogenase